MSRKQDRKRISRRSFLEFGTGAVAATAGLLAIAGMAAGQSAQQEVKTGRGNNTQRSGLGVASCYV